MNAPRPFKDILDQLKSLGIQGSQIYLLDLIPLIEVAWADGVIQKVELLLLREFLRDHIASINEKAGTEILTYKEGCDFLMGFLKERPSTQLMDTLRGLVRDARLSTSDASTNQESQLTILKFCMDIAANATSHYPYGSHDRFEATEKEVFLKVFKALDLNPDRVA